ncbi:phage holin family protein [Sphingomonas sp. ID0503]|uniref:phage holin family protein n=1 Tax=Sphingomonas sp. ID0503 TaxID=3399691 RepID=UPI003AFB45B6
MNEPTVTELIGQLVEDGKAAAHAEIALYKSEAKLRLAKAKVGLILVVGAIVILHLALIAGAVSLTAALATLVGPLAAGLITWVIGLGGAYLLVRIGFAKIKPAFAPRPELRS